MKYIQASMENIQATVKNMAVFYPYVFITIIVSLVFLLMIGNAPTFRIGDGTEYYGLFYAWFDTLRPWMTDTSFSSYHTLIENNSNIHATPPVEWLKSAFPALRIGDTADFNHFWFYSFLAFCISVPFKILGIALNAHNAFLLLHYGLVLGVHLIIYHLYRWQGLFATIIIIFCSPIVWYLNKVHTELYTVIFTLCAVALLHRRFYLAGALFFAIASTQNPSFALIAFIPFFYRVVLQWQTKFTMIEVVFAIGTALTALIHPAYYWFRYGVPTPQLLAGGIGDKNLKHFYIWLIDPNIGLLSYWPFGLLIIFLSVFFLIQAKTQGKQKPFKFEDKFFMLCMVLFTLINFYAQSASDNPNSGGTYGPARYGMWYLPIFFPMLLFILGKTSKKRKHIFSFAIVTFIFAIFNYNLSHPSKPESYTSPTRLSLFIQTHMSFIYSPPDIFGERYYTEAHVGPRAVMGPDCIKMLIYHGRAGHKVISPRHCYKDESSLQIIIDSAISKRDDTAPFYYWLTDVESNHSVSGIFLSKGLYQVGDKDTDNSNSDGNFIFGTGWSGLEHWGVWSVGPKAQLVLPCNSHQFYYERDRLNLNLFVQPFGEQDIQIKQKDNIVYQGKIASPTQLNLELQPLNCKKGRLYVDIYIAKPRAPAGDPRKLGVGLIKYELN